MSKPGEQTGKPECIWCGMKPFRHFGFEMFCEEARVGHKYQSIVFCNSDDPKAFKVYRHPAPPSLPKAGETALRDLIYSAKVAHESSGNDCTMNCSVCDCQLATNVRLAESVLALYREKQKVSQLTLADHIAEVEKMDSIEDIAAYCRRNGFTVFGTYTKEDVLDDMRELLLSN